MCLCRITCGCIGPHVWGQRAAGCSAYPAIRLARGAVSAAGERLSVSMIMSMSIEALFAWLIIIGLVLVVLGFVSFIPARRGHWSAPLLAAPSVLIGGWQTWSTLTSEAPNIIPYVWMFFLALLIMGVAAITLWFVRRRA